MDVGLVFKICNFGVLPFWLLLALAPRMRLTQQLVHSVIIPVCLGTVYALYLILSQDKTPDGAGFGSLEAVMLFFTVPEAMLVGWVHYLVFDLFVGAWEVRDAQRLGINHWLVVPCLLFTLMLGPIGMLLYSILRFATKRRVSLVEHAPEPVVAAATT